MTNSISLYNYNGLFPNIFGISYFLHQWTPIGTDKKGDVYQLAAQNLKFQVDIQIVNILKRVHNLYGER